MSDGVVIGIGNSFRRDDGVGLAVADEIAKRGLADVRVVTAIGEPGAILDAWTGARRSWSMQRWARTPSRGESDTGRQATTPNRASLVSHAFGLPQTYALGEALERLPEKLVGLTVDIADASLGVGFTPPVAAAVPEVIKACWRSSVGVCATRLDTRRQAAIRLRVPPRRWVVLEVQGRRTGRRTQFQVGNPTSMARGAWCRCVASNGIGARACEPQICFWGFSARTWWRPGSPPAVDSVAGAVSGSRQVRREW